MRPIWLSLLALSSFGLAALGCDDAKCEACPANPAGDNLCAVLEGTYFGALSDSSGQCGDLGSLPTSMDGEVRVEVSGIANDPEEPDTTQVKVILTDQKGNWTEFAGSLCNTEDTAAPYTYVFSVSYENTLEAQGQQLQIRNSLDGVFETETSPGPATVVRASYSASLFNPGAPDGGCQVQARLEAAP